MVVCADGILKARTGVKSFKLFLDGWFMFRNLMAEDRLPGFKMIGVGVELSTFYLWYVLHVLS